MSDDNEMSRILDEIGLKPMLTASVVLLLGIMFPVLTKSQRLQSYEGEL
jgi:hypothetical protein